MPTTPEQQFHKDFNKNVVALEQAKRQVTRQINDCLRRNDFPALQTFTNIYLLVYSAWTEANLVKLIHTPSGFSLQEKQRILKDQDVLNKWKKCVNTTFTKFRKSGSEIPNKKKQIHKLLDDYLKSQANIRNKIAHGQWVYPLHKNNITHDAEALESLSIIDVIQIDTWFEVFKEIIAIVLGLIDARTKNNHLAHYNHYFDRLTNIQQIFLQRQNFNLIEKARLLKLKESRKPKDKQ